MRWVLLLALAATAPAQVDAAAGARASAKVKKAYDPEEVVCKERLLGGSRLARVRECATRQQWEEHKQQERLGLMRRQYNGAP